MANDVKEPTGGSTLPLIMLVMMTVGGVVADRQMDLAGQRPLSGALKTAVNHGDETVDGRLWQDPFELINKKIRDMETEKTLEISGKKIKLKGYDPKILERDFQRPNQIVNIQPFDSIQILGVMVPGGPYFENRESRRRTRFAVLAGLSVKGFNPVDANHIGIGYTNKNRDGTNAETMPFLWFPFEWFKNKKNERVLLIWLDDDYFGSVESGLRLPLTKLAKFFKAFRGVGNNSNFGYEEPFPEERINSVVKLLGPSNSGVLKAMINELVEMDPKGRIGKGFRGLFVNGIKMLVDERMFFEIYSPRATVKENRLFGNVCDELEDFNSYKRNSECKNKYEGMTVSEFFKYRQEDILGRNKKPPIHFIRTIATDDQLVKTLFKEFKEWTHGPKCDKESDLPLEKLAVVAEWNSSYGRALKETFIEECSNSSGKSADPQPKKNFFNVGFKYLQGLDGQVPGDLKKLPAAKGSTDNEKDLTDERRGRRPEGNSQKDYLVRLGDRMSKVNDELENKQLMSEVGFGAIGILGNDFYDKLLVLRAIRKQFPHALFFTTDMDARYFIPSEYPYVRNLLVASSFGLELNEGFQKGIPPFRNNYQTSTFWATQLALTPVDNKIPPPQRCVDELIRPLIYEIGRTQTFLLFQSNEQLLDPANECRRFYEESGLWPWVEKGKNPLYPEPRSFAPHDLRVLTLLGALLIISCLVFLVFNGFKTAAPKIKQVWKNRAWGLKIIWVDLVVFSIVPIVAIGVWVGFYIKYGLQSLSQPFSEQTLILLVSVLWFFCVFGLKARFSKIKQAWEKTEFWLKRIWSVFVVILIVAINPFIESRIIYSPQNLSPLSFLKQVLTLLGFLLVVSVVLYFGFNGFKKGVRKIKRKWRNPSGWFGVIWGGFYFSIIVAIGVYICFWIFKDPQPFSHPFGEPFAWFEGVSVWPTNLLRFLSAFLALFLLYRAYRKLSVHFFKIKKRYLSVFKEFFKKKSKKEDKNKGVNEPCGKLLRNSREKNFGRALIWAVVVYVATVGVFSLFGWPHTPARGTSHIVSLFLVGFMVISFFWLLFFVGEELKQNISVIKVMGTPSSLHELKGNCLKGHAIDWDKVLQDVRFEETKVRFIAARSSEVNSMILYPFYLIVLMMFSRWHYFDHWIMSTPLLLVIISTILYPTFFVLLLLVKARKLKAESVQNLEFLRMEAGKKDRGSKKGKLFHELCNENIKRIEGLRRGAFMPIWEQPLVGAILVPFGGVGGITMLEYFLMRS